MLLYDYFNFAQIFVFNNALDFVVGSTTWFQALYLSYWVTQAFNGQLTEKLS